MWLTFGNEALQAIHDCRWQIVCCVFMLIFAAWDGLLWLTRKLFR